MGSKGGFVLFGLLLILFVLCHSGHSLKCYNCIIPVENCTTITSCSEDLDACLYLKGEHTYHQCWKFDKCSFKDLSVHFGEKKLKYDCCQKDLCNRSDRMSASGKTFLLMTQLLAAFWKFFL